MTKRKKKAASTKVSVTGRIDADVVARARGAVIAIQYSGKSCSLQGLIELALIDYLAKLEKRGHKITPRPRGVLKTGHPITTTTTAEG